MTREEWLDQVCQLLSDHVFKPVGYTIPKVKLSVGFPSKNATSTKKRTIGQCWKAECSEDRVNQIFCSPVLNNSYEMADVLCHELVHAVDNCENGHKAVFKRICKDIGLTKGKATSASAGPELFLKIGSILRVVGPIPHSGLLASSIKKQTTRMIKVVCPDCGYTLRTTAQWLDVGLPICCCGTEMEVA